MSEIKVYQQILFITTKQNNLRSEAQSWGCEFGNFGADTIQIDPQCHIGLVRSHPAGTQYCYQTPAHAMRFGWKLFSADPTSEGVYGWNWTMFRNVDKEGNVVG